VSSENIDEKDFLFNLDKREERRFEYQTLILRFREGRDEVRIKGQVNYWNRVFYTELIRQIF